MRETMIGNKFALGNEGGRPPKFETPEELQNKVNEYLEKYPLGERTITGLALYLGFESRQSLYDYQEKKEFTYIIKRARLEVESSYESGLYGKNATGAIFALKNMGWKDRQEFDHTNNGGDFGGIDYKALTKETLEDLDRNIVGATDKAIDNNE